MQRNDVLDPDDENKKIHEVDPSILRRRQPVGEQVDPAEIAEATGIMDYVRHLEQRKEKLEAGSGNTDGIVAPAAVSKRIDDLKDALEKRDIRVDILGIGLVYRFAIRGPAKVIDEGDVLDGTIGTSPTWPVRFWVGAWDADALCGYMRGDLQVPFRPSSMV